MKIYHYTKCNRLNSIFEDGFIATEKKRTISYVEKITDYVWLTEKQNYPKTELPMLSSLPETSLLIHLKHQGIHVDLDKIGAILGKFYRFSFDTSDEQFIKWFHSKERTVARCNNEWIGMESMANKVGDDIRSFWITTENLSLNNFSLEVFDSGWKLLLENVDINNLNADSKITIDELKAASIQNCKKFSIPSSHQPLVFN